LVADTLALTFLRSVIAAISIFLLVWVTGQKIRLEKRRDYAICFLAGFLLGVHWLSFFYSMRISTVTLGMTTLYTYPIITLWLEAFILKKKVHTRDLINTFIVVTGVLLIGMSDAIGINSETLLSKEVSANNILGVSLGLVSALCFAARNILQQQCLSAHTPHKTIFYQVITISFLLLIFLGAEVFQTISIDLVIQEGYQWVLLGVFFTALPHSLMASGIKNIGAKSVSIIGCLQPVIGTFIAYFMLDELSSNIVVIGCVVIMTGAVLEIYHQGKLNQRK
jgi:drug/metabolite transporter (DMT)-like permease